MNNPLQIIDSFKKIISNYYLQVIFLSNLFIFSISNSNLAFILITKLVLLTFNLIFSFYIINKHSLKLNIHLSFLILFLIYSFLSMTYSPNQSNASKKLLLMLNIIPFGIMGYLIYDDNNNLDKFLKLLLILFVPLIFISIIIRPFDATQTYSFSFSRWSHVLFSRFIGAAFILSLFSKLNYKYKAIILSILLLGLLYSGARGPLLFILLLLVYYIIRNYKNNNTIKILFLIFFVIAIFFFFFINFSNKRILELLMINNFLKSDGVVVRIASWGIAIKMFLDNYIFGAGLGGFDTNLYSELGAQLHYPHNIILEVLSELGIFGFILFSIIMIFTLHKLKSYPKEIFILFLFSFYLALFSKDLSSNPFLFSLVFFYVDKESSTSSLLKNNIIKST